MFVHQENRSCRRPGDPGPRARLFGHPASRLNRELQLHRIPQSGHLERDLVRSWGQGADLEVDGSDFLLDRAAAADRAGRRRELPARPARGTRLPDESLLDRMPKPRSFPHAGRADALAPEHAPSLPEVALGPERYPDAKGPGVGLERPFGTDDAHDVERILLLPLRRRRGGGALFSLRSSVWRRSGVLAWVGISFLAAA